MPTNSTAALLEVDVYPDTSLLVTEDGKPVDNLLVEKQYRLLTEPLCTSWKSPQDRPFRVLANVGLFFQYKEPPLVPDTMFAIDVAPPPEARKKDFRSYFTWIVGKVPDIVIEIVSDKRGGEDTDKLAAYERISVPFYVIFDPDEVLDGGLLRTFYLEKGKYRPTDPARFSDFGLGLALWEGEYEGVTETWLRWTDGNGKIVLSGRESAAAEARRARSSAQRADEAIKQADESTKRANEEAKRANEEAKRANEEAKRADEEAKRAHEATERIKQLEAKLRAAGISVDG